MRGRRPGQRDDHRAPVLSGIDTAQTVTILGRELAFPIEVRSARSWAAQFLVDASEAQHLIDHTGLRIAPVLPGRGMLTIAFVDYEDSDLGAYHELGVIFLVRGPHGRGVYVHHLPVDQEFTLAAGREIWGYPKSLARISIEPRGRETTCTLDGVLEITVRGGVVPMPQPALPTYTHMDGVLRSTSWRMEGAARARPGGARMSLGSHPIADELRALGLPKRALMCSTVARYRATFDPPRVLARV